MKALILEPNVVRNRLINANYQVLAKVSKATATRELADLVNKNCIFKLPGGGRSTRYAIHLITR